MKEKEGGRNCSSTLHCTRPRRPLNHVEGRGNHVGGRGKRGSAVGSTTYPQRKRSNAREAAINNNNHRRLLGLGGFDLVQRKVVGGHAGVVLGVKPHDHGVLDAALFVRVCSEEFGDERAARRGC